MARLDKDYLERYRELTRELTKTVVNEVFTGEYVNFKNPNNRSNGPIELDHDKLIRFRIIARPPGITVKGNRTLDLGHNEALLFLHGELGQDFSKGMDLNVFGAKYRWVFGELIGYDSVIEGVDRDFANFVLARRDLVESGRYSDFVRGSMDLLDRRIQILRMTQSTK